MAFKGSVYCRRWTHEGKTRKAWGIRWSVNGGPVKREIVADTKEAAKGELDKKRDDYQRRLLGVEEGKTLNDLAPLFLAHKANQGRAMEPIRFRVNSNLLPCFGTLPLEDIDAEAVDRYIQERKGEYVKRPCKSHDGQGKRCSKCDKRIASATINRDLAVLRHMLRLAVRKWRWLRQEPYIELLPEGGPRERELTEAEEAKLLPACPADFRPLVQTALLTGMRMGELLALAWQQVDLINRTLDFPPTKRGRKRLLPIAEPLYYVLERLKAGREASGGPKPADRVFLRTDGRPWNKWAVENRFGRAVAAAKIAPIRFHDLRHTIASRLKRAGVHETEIQRLLGHKTLSMTDRYINVEVEQLRAALAVLPSTTDAQGFFPSTNMTQEREASESLSGNLMN